MRGVLWLLKKWLEKEMSKDLLSNGFQFSVQHWTPTWNATDQGDWQKENTETGGTTNRTVDGINLGTATVDIADALTLA